jgi:hypothetical protein
MQPVNVLHMISAIQARHVSMANRQGPVISVNGVGGGDNIRGKSPAPNGRISSLGCVASRMKATATMAFAGA